MSRMHPLRGRLAVLTALAMLGSLGACSERGSGPGPGGAAGGPTGPRSGSPGDPSVSAPLGGPSTAVIGVRLGRPGFSYCENATGRRLLRVPMTVRRPLTLASPRARGAGVRLVVATVAPGPERSVATISSWPGGAPRRDERTALHWADRVPARASALDAGRWSLFLAIDAEDGGTLDSLDLTWTEDDGNPGTRSVPLHVTYARRCS